MLDPEHQPGQCRAGAAAGEAGLAARGPVHLRARAVHDRHGEARRRRAAGDHVPRARRHLSRRRQPAHHARAEADRPAGRAAHQPLRHRGTGQAARRRRYAGLRPDRAAAHRHHARQARARRFRELQGATMGRRAAGFRDGAFPQRLRPSPTASSASGRTGPARSRRTGRRKAWACRAVTSGCRNSRTMST